MQNQLPKTGFVRLHQILSVFPVSKSSWWAGVKSHKYPQSLKHGRATFWKAEDINALIESVNNGD